LVGFTVVRDCAHAAILVRDFASEVCLLHNAAVGLVSNSAYAALVIIH
jgi:hypothetical protein